MTTKNFFEQLEAKIARYDLLCHPSPKIFMPRVLKTICLCLALLLLGPRTPFAAEYQGQDIDGVVYDATAYSYGTGKYYSVSVEFDGDEATIYFQKGGHIIVTLDDEEIDDPHNISAFDYDRSVYWDLDVDGLD